MKKTIKVNDIWHEIENLVVAKEMYHQDGRKHLESGCEDKIDILLLILIRYSRSGNSEQFASELDDIYYHYFEIREKCFANMEEIANEAQRQIHTL